MAIAMANVQRTRKHLNNRSNGFFHSSFFTRLRNMGQMISMGTNIIKAYVMNIDTENMRRTNWIVWRKRSGLGNILPLPSYLGRQTHEANPIKSLTQKPRTYIIQPRVGREVEGDASQAVTSVFEVAIESQRYIKTTRDDHGRVEHAVPRKKCLRSLHFVLQRQDNANSLRKKKHQRFGSLNMVQGVLFLHVMQIQFRLFRFFLMF